MFGKKIYPPIYQYIFLLSIYLSIYLACMIRWPILIDGHTPFDHMLWKEAVWGGGVHCPFSENVQIKKLLCISFTIFCWCKLELQDFTVSLNRRTKEKIWIFSAYSPIILFHLLQAKLKYIQDYCHELWWVTKILSVLLPAVHEMQIQICGELSKKNSAQIYRVTLTKTWFLEKAC